MRILRSKKQTSELDADSRFERVVWYAMRAVGLGMLLLIAYFWGTIDGSAESGKRFAIDVAESAYAVPLGRSDAFLGLLSRQVLEGLNDQKAKFGKVQDYSIEKVEQDLFGISTTVTFSVKRGGQWHHEVMSTHRAPGIATYAADPKPNEQ